MDGLSDDRNRMRRRQFLRRSALLGIAAGAGGAMPVALAQAVVNVRDFGAKGDGASNDTAAFRDAVAAVPAGGIVTVPAGTYMLNCDPEWCVRLKSNMALELQAGAKLKAIPTDLERHYVLWIDQKQHVDIYGLGSGDRIAQIIGERDEHMGQGGEWGQGIRIVGSSDISISKVRISRFWGDGIVVGAKGGRNSADVVVAGVVCTGNRRQGMSITGVDRMDVSDSEFSNTRGTAPEDGIDIEPDTGGSVTGVTIRRCLLRGNAGNGLELNALAGEGYVVRDIEVRNSDIVDNDGYGIYANHARGVWYVENRIKENWLKGLRIAARCLDHAVGQNTFVNNALNVPPPRDPSPACRTLTGLQSGVTGWHVEVVPGAAAINVNQNTYCR